LYSIDKKQRSLGAREIAFSALLRVELDGAFLDRVLPAAFQRYQLSPEDSALATELTYGVLRTRLILDSHITPAE